MMWFLLGISDCIYYLCPCLRSRPSAAIYGLVNAMDPSNMLDVLIRSSSVIRDHVDENEVTPNDTSREYLEEVFSTEQEAIDEIRKEGFETAFASKAQVVIEMEFQGGKTLSGNIKRVIGLKISENEPIRDVRFHIKFNPSNKHKQKTEWKPVDEQLHMTTFFAKTTRKTLDKSRLLVRMYGRKHKLGRERCFGQILIPLSKVTEKRKRWRKFLMPRSTPIDMIPRIGAFAAQCVVPSASKAQEGNNDQPQEE